jgi:hypothetical protein
MPFSSADPSSYVALGMQSAKGTPQVTAGKQRFVKYLSGNDFQPVMDVQDLREGGDGLDFGFSYKRTQKAQGQLVANARPEVMGQLFQLMPGGATWDGGSAPAIHTFHTGHASFPYGTMNIAYPATSLVHLVSDVKFTGLTIEANSGEPIKITAPYTALVHAASAAPLTATNYGEAPILFYNAPSYLIDGTADTTISAFKLDLALGTDELQAQSVGLDDILIMNRDANLEITRRFEDPTLWKKINFGGGIVATQSVATGSFEAIALYGSGASERKLRIVTPLISYRGDTLPQLDPDGKTVIETISAKVLKGATAAVIFQVENAHASAYAP